MASYPTAKKHAPSRRRLGRGQTAPVPQVTATASAATVTVTVAFDRPVVVSGQVPLVVVGHGDVPVQTVIDSQHVRLVFAASVAGAAWSLAGNQANVRSFQGGVLAPASGTF